jgi:hypothetical protein
MNGRTPTPPGRQQQRSARQRLRGRRRGGRHLQRSAGDGLRPVHRCGPQCAGCRLCRRLISLQPVQHGLTLNRGGKLRRPVRNRGQAGKLGSRRIGPANRTLPGQGLLRVLVADGASGGRCRSVIQHNGRKLNISTACQQQHRQCSKQNRTARAGCAGGREFHRRIVYENRKGCKPCRQQSATGRSLPGGRCCLPGPSPRHNDKLPRIRRRMDARKEPRIWLRSRARI